MTSYHQKAFWRTFWRMFTWETWKTLWESTTKQGYIPHAFLTEVDGLLLSLVNCNAGMKGYGENSLTHFCQGRPLNHHIMASGNHSQILLCKCLLHQRTTVFNNWTANKPPLIFKIKRKLEGIKKHKYRLNLQFLLTCLITRGTLVIKYILVIPLISTLVLFQLYLTVKIYVYCYCVKLRLHTSTFNNF